MPLRAILDGKDIISIYQDDNQWNLLKSKIQSNDSVLQLSCCKQKGFLRISKNGLKHFVHARSKEVCNWEPESQEHLKAKIDIIESCDEHGWTAIPEYSESNWRADVLAIKGDVRIAFEVQWSRQTLEETKFRQERYKKSNVRGCWFFRIAPKELRVFDEDYLIADNTIPAFRIFKQDDEHIFAQLNQQQLPLKFLVGKLLNRKLKICNKTKAQSPQNVEIIFFKTNCWKCDKTQYLWTVERNLISKCNEKMTTMSMMWNNKDFDKNAAVYEAVRKFTASKDGEGIKIGELKFRHSKTTNQSYLSHGCYYCDALFGDFFVSEEKLHNYYDTTNIRHNAIVNIDDYSESDSHWCYSEIGDFCEK